MTSASAVQGTPDTGNRRPTSRLCGSTYEALCHAGGSQRPQIGLYLRLASGSLAQLLLPL